LYDVYKPLVLEENLKSYFGPYENLYGIKGED
jgi:hypothetical protein